jgi:hypothetical protein
MKTLRFADGTPVPDPDDDAAFDPNVGARYGQASRDRMAELRAKIDEALARRGLRPGRHPADKASFSANLAKESHVKPENAVPVGFPRADPIDLSDVWHTSWGMVREGTFELETRTVLVPLLRATQPVIDSERVARDEAAYRDHGQDPDHYPWVLERDGLFFVLSGHHHVQAAINAGATELRVEEMTAAAP